MAVFDGVKIGDKVWDFVYGCGEVVSFIDDDDYPIVVKFNNTIESYTLDGRPNKKSNQTLFWGKIKYEIPEKPKIELKEKAFLIDLLQDYIANYSNYKIENAWTKNGLMRNDKLTAELALKQIKRFVKLLALRDQECISSREYEFRKGKDNYFISYSIRDGAWDYSYVSGHYEPDKVYFKTKEDAQKICDILNSGKFDLEGE